MTKSHENQITVAMAIEKLQQLSTSKVQNFILVTFEQDPDDEDGVAVQTMVNCHSSQIVHHIGSLAEDYPQAFRHTVLRGLAEKVLN